MAQVCGGGNDTCGGFLRRALIFFCVFFIKILTNARAWPSVVGVFKKRKPVEIGRGRAAVRFYAVLQMPLIGKIGKAEDGMDTSQKTSWK